MIPRVAVDDKTIRPVVYLVPAIGSWLTSNCVICSPQFAQKRCRRSLGLGLSNRLPQFDLIGAEVSCLWPYDLASYTVTFRARGAYWDGLASQTRKCPKGWSRDEGAFDRFSFNHASKSFLTV